MKSYKKHKLIILGLTMVGTICVLPTLASAKVQGPCADCHTMHNSQNNVSMSYLDTGGTTFAPQNAAVGDDDTANGVLLRYGCVGCHTGVNAGGNVPFVFNAAAIYGTDTLAGGDFRWVIADSAKGHNVKDLPDIGTETFDAPGGDMVPDTLTCAGVNGCHGDGTDDQFGSIAGGHHGSGAAANGYVSGSTTDMSDAFRMLSGIIGIEDSDWEYTTNVGTGDHNVYAGAHRTDESDTTGTISKLCANCHGDFHSGAGNVGTGSPWVRHPTDFDMSTLAGTSEYASYTYSIDAPVAVTAATISDATVPGDIAAWDHGGGDGAGAGLAIVTCLSCHRAHGSEYDDLLRWDYTGMVDSHTGVGGGTGCFICHTTKDDA